MNIEVITKWLFICVTVVAVLLFLMLCITQNRRKKQGTLRGKYWVKRVVVSVLLVVLIVANGAINQFNNVINQVFCAVQVDASTLDDATIASRDVTSEIESEGIVLLENKNNTLP